MSENAQPRLMSPRDAAAETTLSTVQLAVMASAGLFPKPIQISERRQAYVRSEVTAWLDERIARRETLAKWIASQEAQSPFGRKQAAQ